MENNIVEKLIEKYNFIIGKIGESNPKLARTTFNKLNYIVITIANYQRLKKQFKLEETKDLKKIYRILQSINLIDRCDYELVSDFLEENIDILNELVNIIESYNSLYDIFDLYENIISNDIVVKESYYSVIKENKARDRSGSYYTSKKFARNIVKKTIDDYVCNKLSIDKNELEELIASKSDKLKRLLSKSKYTDLSSGTGHFIISLIEYIDEILNDEEVIKEIILNIYAFDVDFIALQVLRSELFIRYGNIDKSQFIKSNTILGNTLINLDDVDYTKMLELVSEGYIYHSQIGINQNKFIGFFDVIIGNPPWEKIRFEDKNFFTNYCPTISSINKKNERMKEIINLNKSNPNLKKYYDNFNLGIEISKKQIKENDKFRNSSKGELNTYNLFTELAVNFLKNDGCITLIIKSGLITTSANSKIFKFLLEHNLLKSIYDFINKNKIFPIDSRERFAVLFLQKYFYEDFNLKMMLENIDDINSSYDGIKLNQNILRKINPETEMIPNISSVEELDLLLEFYEKFKVFEQEFSSCKYGRLVHLTNHSDSIYKTQGEGNIPIYEGKFIERYDNKFSTFKNVSEEKKYASKATSIEMSEEDKVSIEEIPESRYFIDKDKWKEITKNYNNEYTLYWRSLTSAKNKRTTIATILPHIPTIQSLQLLQCDNNKDLIIILSLFNSAIFDYLVRLKLNGIDLTPTIIKQIPVPSKDKFKKNVLFKGIFDSIENHIAVRVKELYKNDYRNNAIFKELKLKDLNLEVSNKELILEIDYLISKVYEITIKDLINIMSTFTKYYSEKDILYVKGLK